MILLADDNATLRMVFTKMAKHFGAAVETVEDGSQAVDACIRNSELLCGYQSELRCHYEMIFMDLHMPIMNGFEATRELRRLGIKTPIIGFTASALITDRENCLAAGMNDVLTKPFSLGQLKTMLTSWSNNPSWSK
jgi:CheY-like chemotaxis protein